MKLREKILLRVFTAFLFLFVIYNLIPRKTRFIIAQGIELACPSPLNSIGPSFDFRSPTTGGIRQYFCIDSSGKLFLNGASTTVSGVYAANYGVQAKGVQWNDASWGSGLTPTVTIAVTTGNGDAPFTTNMVGWLMFGTNGAATTQTPTATAVLPVGKITSFISSTQVGVTPNASATACASNPGAALCRFFAAPNDDTVALLAAGNAAFLPNGTTTDQGYTLILPPGYMWVSGAIVNNAWNCDLLTSSNGSANGCTVTGAGKQATVIVPVPSVGNYNPGANNASFFFTNSTRGKGWHYKGFSIDGLGQNAALGSQPFSALFLNQNSDAIDVGVYQWGSNFGIITSGGDGAEANLDNVNIVEAGTTACLAAGSYTRIENSFIDWCISSHISTSGFHVVSINNTYDNPGGTAMLTISGSDFTSIGDLLQTMSVNSGIYFNLTSGIAHVSHMQIKTPNSSNDIGIKTLGGTTLYLSDTLVALNAQAGTQALNIAGTLVNLGGNSIATVAANSITGSVINNAISESGNIACAASAATITFKGTYLNAPFYLIQDRTTAGVVTQTSENTTTLVLGCPGATDNLNYIISPNNF